MAKEGTTQEQKSIQAEGGQQPPAPEKLPLKKIFLIGIPLFLVQVVVVYLIVLKLVVPTSTTSDTVPYDAGASEQAAESDQSASGENIYIIRDIIINPAGTNGSRYLLVTIGLEANSKVAWQELTQKEVQVRDVLNTILTSKTLFELVDITKREALRSEIAKKITALLKSGTVKSVYFSKYIIQ